MILEAGGISILTLNPSLFVMCNYADQKRLSQSFGADVAISFRAAQDFGKAAPRIVARFETRVCLQDNNELSLSPSR